MRAVKWIFIVIVALLLLLAAGGALLSPQFTVTRSVTIAAPAQKIYPLLEDPRRWKEWTVWNRRDPAMQISYSGPPSGAGAGWAWKSRSEGDGSMTFTTAEPGRRLGYELFFPDFGTTSRGELRLAEQAGATQVTWVMNGDFGSNPLLRWMTLMADGMVGKDFEAGLANLKALAEKP